MQQGPFAMEHSITSSVLARNEDEMVTDRASSGDTATPSVHHLGAGFAGLNPHPEWPDFVGRPNGAEGWPEHLELSSERLPESDCTRRDRD
jgi:hypothetical protein